MDSKVDCEQLEKVPYSETLETSTIYILLHAIRQSAWHKNFHQNQKNSKKGGTQAVTSSVTFDKTSPFSPLSPKDTALRQVYNQYETGGFGNGHYFRDKGKYSDCGASGRG